jgi:hypothetical protein
MDDICLDPYGFPVSCDPDELDGEIGDSGLPDDPIETCYDDWGMEISCSGSFFDDMDNPGEGNPGEGGSSKWSKPSENYYFIISIITGLILLKKVF